MEKLLGVTAEELTELIDSDEHFPATQQDEPSPFQYAAGEEPDWGWDGGGVYRWAALSTRFRDRGALLLNPDLRVQTSEAGRWIGYQSTPHGPAMDWQTELGAIRVIHTTKHGAASAMAEELAKEGGGAHGVVTVCALIGDIGWSGPALLAADTAQPQLEYEAQWNLVMKLAGHALPWWPRLLRRADVISQWSPGAPITVAEVLPGKQETTLRRAAESGAFDHVERTALTDLANALRNQRAESVNSDIRIFGRHSSRLKGERLLIAAQHRTEGYPLPRIDDQELLAEGWRTIAASQLFEAYEPLRIGRIHDSRLLPYGPQTEVPTNLATSRRWAQQLTACAPTALHAVLAGDAEDATFYTDEATGIPAVRRRAHRQSTWVFLSPLRLPDSGARLRSVILDDIVWITTTDGGIYPGPCTPSDHLWWGDGWGDRPTEAAWVISQLLDSLGTKVSLNDHWNHAPGGLMRLLNHQHPYGMELSRSMLESARSGPLHEDPEDAA
ncbi:hypothetical protein OG204_03080 [Streptomyces sp. NBC_01387]|uniref:hypothetical protein n=1 Tax=unclassified Streptomyces TaxID=2593676 RepID=UPI002024518A|nr:hypothetical protein [Streptomyces sp. A 4/2]WSV57953.1 hypothetical protein OG282_32045 [Streptomyces sp. NBC_01014]